MNATSPPKPASTPGPGRPSTGARERILEAALETLKVDGYAGLTTAKVAARARENKALIAYHFGSKQGLVIEAARILGDLITIEVVAGLGEAGTVDAIVSGATGGVWRILARDVRLARAYFDLNAVSVPEDEVRAVLREVKGRWRSVLGSYLERAGVPPKWIPSSCVLLLAGLEGLALEWIERGSTPELEEARCMFERAAATAITATEGAG